MYWSIYVVSVVVLILVVMTLPFIKRFREWVDDNLNDTPFYVFYAIQRYTGGKNHYYDEISVIEVMFYYFGYLILSIVLVLLLSIFWPLLLFLLIIYIPIKFILNKQKHKQ